MRKLILASLLAIVFSLALLGAGGRATQTDAATHDPILFVHGYTSNAGACQSAAASAAVGYRGGEASIRVTWLCG